MRQSQFLHSFLKTWTSIGIEIGGSCLSVLRPHGVKNAIEVSTLFPIKSKPPIASVPIAFEYEFIVALQKADF
jgi:hypothetical protein